jgi:tRNA pseudouridine38-40 synthase
MLALRVAYDGSSYHGSQRQPHHPTVEGELLHAFWKTSFLPRGEVPSLFRFASRTDKGVSARENILFIGGETGSLFRHNELRRMTKHLEDIWITGYTTTPYRPPYMKEYHDHLGIGEYPIPLLNALCSVFSGTHDFSRFCRVRGSKSPQRTLSMTFRMEHGDTCLIFRGPGFLWQMCRRIASSFYAVWEGDMHIDDVVEMLREPDGHKMPPAPASQLLLYSVDVKAPFHDYVPAQERMHEYYEKKVNASLARYHVALDVLNGDD